MRPTGLVEGWTYKEQTTDDRTKAIMTAGGRALENDISLWFITTTLKEMFLGIQRPDDLVTQLINVNVY